MLFSFFSAMGVAECRVNLVYRGSAAAKPDGRHRSMPEGFLCSPHTYHGICVSTHPHAQTRTHTDTSCAHTHMHIYTPYVNKTLSVG